MKIIERKELKRKYTLGKKESLFVSECIKLKKDQGLIVEAHEWDKRITPVQYVHANKYNPRSRMYGLDLFGHKIDGGWVIKRK